jgi:hypothetical protein
VGFERGLCVVLFQRVQIGSSQRFSDQCLFLGVSEVLERGLERAWG